MKIAILGLVIASAPTMASHYHAEPAAKPAAATLILRDTVWKCGDAGCAGSRSNSRPATVCALLARKVGNLRSFSVNGEALGAFDLEKCNARAN